MDSLISPWIISGEVGLRKPDAAIFELLLSCISLAAQDCLLVDDRVEVLDTTKALGFRTVLFRSAGDGRGSADGVNDHPHVATFSDLERLILSQVSS